MALVRSTAKSWPHEVLDIVPLEPRTNSERLPASQLSIELPARPSKICASQNSVTAELPSTTGPRSVTYDAVTGKEIRFEPGAEGTVSMDCGVKAARSTSAGDDKDLCPVRVAQKGTDVKDAKGMVTNPHSVYEIHWASKKSGQFKAEMRTISGETKPLNRFNCSVADYRWLAYREDLKTDESRVKDKVYLLDLLKSEVIWAFQTDQKVQDVEFEADNSLLKVNFDKNVIFLPVDTDLLKRYVKWLQPRELTDLERCKYGLGGKETRALCR